MLLIFIYIASYLSFVFFYIVLMIVFYVEDMTTMVEIGPHSTFLLYSSGCRHLTYVTVFDFFFIVKLLYFCYSIR